MSTRRLGFRLLAITPPTGEVDVGLVAAWEPGRAVGMAVLLREPGTPLAALVGPEHRLTALRLACARAGVPCLLSVDVAGLAQLGEAARATGITGIQLRGDPSVEALEAARRILPPGHRLGRSCHGRPDPMGERVDYSVLAPIFGPHTASPTPGPGKQAVGLAPLRAFAAVERHVLALGGITPERARVCVEAGAFGVAAIAGFFGSLPWVADNVSRLAQAVVEPSDDAAPPP